jgi:hypothetical protein
MGEKGKKSNACKIKRFSDEGKPREFVTSLLALKNAKQNYLVEGK